MTRSRRLVHLTPLPVCGSGTGTSYQHPHNDTTISVFLDDCTHIHGSVQVPWTNTNGYIDAARTRAWLGTEYLRSTGHLAALDDLLRRTASAVDLYELRKRTIGTSNPVGF